VSSYAVDRAAWEKRTIFEQMGNIGSEVGRALHAQKRGNVERMWQAAARADDLFEATASQWRGGRLREILRAREQFMGALLGESADGLENYFMQFAVAARSGR